MVKANTKRTLPPSSEAHAPRQTLPRPNKYERAAMDTMAEGPKTLIKASALELSLYHGLVRRGFAADQGGDCFELTEIGYAIVGTKMGRPSTVKGVWAMLFDHYGGMSGFAEEVGVSENTVRQWALHNRPPSGPARKAAARLAKEANLPGPWA